jgi:methylenetetrahydrofolate dehydrogenase (NADP+) / methenyltetrahydrofolate cyclohydrolase
MTAKIIDGKMIAAELRGKVADAVHRLARDRGIVPGLAVVLVGDNPASQIYVGSKKKMVVAGGMRSFDHTLPEHTSEAELLKLIGRLNTDPTVSGILVQLPLPKHIDTHHVIAAIDPAKDVDGFHPCNIGLLAQKRPRLRPCTPYGVIRLAQEYGIALQGLRATVVGASNIVGRPMALELMLAGATVTVCHTRTRDLKAEVERAELVVAAAGKPAMVRGEWIRPGAAVFDVGINRTEAGRLVGDVEYEAAAQRAGWITPVPGGIGPMTIAMLLSNTLDAAGWRVAP